MVVYICEPSGDFAGTYYSSGVSAQLGWQSADFLNDPGFWASHIHPADKERVNAGLSELLENNHHRHEYRFQHKDGSYRWIEDVMRLEHDASGDPVRIVGYRTDISRQKQAEQSKHDSEAQYRSIIDNMAEMFYRTDLDGRVVMVSPAVEELLGYTPDETTGRELANHYVDPEGRAKFLDILASNNGIVRDYQTELRRKDGSTVWVSTNSQYVRDGEGNIVGVEGTVRNITEQKRAEQALSDSETRYRQLAELSPDGMFVHVDGEIVFANDSLARILAVPSPDHFLGKMSFDLLAPEHRARALERRDDLMRGDVLELEQFEYLRSDGSRVSVANSGTLVSWDNKPAVLVLVRDITEREEAKSALRESRDQLRLITDNLPVWITYIDTDLCYRFVNKTSIDWHAQPVEEIIGKSISELLGPDYEKLRSRIDRALAGEQLTFVENVAFPDGVRRTIRATYIPHFGATGRVEGYFTLSEDISELQRTEEALRQAQKMEAVGQLTGGVAHDFNNLLAVILGNAELLHDQIDNNQLLATIERAATRGADLTQRLLAFSRQQVLEPRSIDLKELIPGLEDLLRRTLGEPITVVTDIPAEIWPVLADPGQFENALLNLAINARDAMPSGGILEIGCGNVQLRDGDSRVADEVPAGYYVQITVRDTGTGIPDDLLEHVFEPFYSTKGVGEGSGLGLSMVYGFARQSGGDTAIESSPGKGTEVKLFLPRSEVATVPDVHTQDNDLKWGMGEAILVLEDNPDVRAFAVEALEGLSYRVLEATDANTAMLVLEEEAGDVDLLLCDVVLPGGVSGPEFAAKAKDLYPKLKLVFMSGYAADLYTDDRIPGFDETLLPKPYRRVDLAKVIHDSLTA